MEKWKNWAIIHCAKVLKVISVAVMLTTLCMMIYDKTIDTSVLPQYFEFSTYDWWGWALVLLATSLVQIYLLFHTDDYAKRVIGDVVLSFSGILMGIIGWAFLAKYPPINGLMIFYPVMAILFCVAGRHINKRSRQRLDDFKKGQK